MRAFTAAKLISGAETIERPLLLVEDRKIVEVASRDTREAPAGISVSDLGAGWIVPGYIDLHIHGSAGHDVMDSDPDALPGIELLLARHGVTSYYPTTVTAPMDTTLHALERLADAIESRRRGDNSAAGRACPLGIHLEGPFLSHARRGVHPPENLLTPTLGAFERMWQAARGTVRMMTIAPELDGAQEVIAEAARRGVCVSLGHSDADLATAARGIAAGARHATHTFNAMRPLDHRSPGILGAVLSDDHVSADMIVDGVHLDPAIVRLVASAKGADRTVLITDATSATGMPEGRYRLGSFEVEVRDGKVTHDGRLAGSVLTMDRAVRNLAQFTGWDLAQAVAAATRNPARVGHLINKGELVAGADADFVVLNEAGEVLRTLVGGAEG
jgi:N-acetylglucosamine-6-phosphate deacetylase